MELVKGNIKNNGYVTNDDMNEVFIMLTMILPSKKIYNNKEKALE